MDMNPAERDRLVAQMLRATAEQLRAERAASGLTIDAVSKAAGMDRKTIMRLESGERGPSVAQIASLCGVYGLAITEFMVLVQGRVDSPRATSVDGNQRGVVG